MKTLKIQQLFLALFFLISSFTGMAQVNWVGGFPGQETNWEQARNWYPQRVPGSEDLVRIPDRSAQGAFYPVITQETEAVLSVFVEGNARLVVESSGTLMINADFVPGYGLYILGIVDNQGTIKMENTVGPPVMGDLGLLESRGDIWIIDQLNNVERYYQNGFEYDATRVENESSLANKQ